MVPANLSILTQGLRPQLPETRKHVTLNQIKHPRGKRLRSQNYAESRAPRYLTEENKRFKMTHRSQFLGCTLYNLPNQLPFQEG